VNERIDSGKIWGIPMNTAKPAGMKAKPNDNTIEANTPLKPSIYFFSLLVHENGCIRVVILALGLPVKLRNNALLAYHMYQLWRYHQHCNGWRDAILCALLTIFWKIGNECKPEILVATIYEYAPVPANSGPL
jgi:hypothetical protein